MISRHVITCLAVLGCCALFAYFALDGHMYWHEGRLLYAVSHFSIADLIAGRFNPNQLGGEINTLESGGYHLSKVLYLMLLKALTRLPTIADTQILFGSLLSLVAVLACAWYVRGTLHALGASLSIANWSMVAFLLMPLAPYLAGKLLSEVPALFLALTALYLWSRTPNLNSSSNFIRASVTGILVSTAALARLDIVIVHIGFVAASLVNASYGTRAHLIRLHGYVAVVATLLYLGVIVSINGSFSSLYQYLVNYISLSPKSTIMSVFGIVSFGGLMWVFVVVGYLSRTQLSRFLMIWLLVASLPIIAIVANYMIEPRYLVAASMPFAGLAGIGLSCSFGLLQSALSRSVAIGVLVMVVVLNAIPVALMPYEIDRNAILDIVDTYVPENSNATLLIPYSYSDFHFLRYARPGSNVINVYAPGGDLNNISTEWNDRLRSWYGDRYVTDPETIIEILGRGHVFYLGWGVYPPIETVMTWAGAIGLDSLQQWLSRLYTQEHRAESWLWKSPRYNFEPIWRHGQYTVYAVTLSK